MPVARGQLLEAPEAKWGEPFAKPLHRRPDRRRRPAGVGDHHGSPRRRDPGELGEEGDHVEQDDEVERAVLEGERRGVGDLEAHAPGELLRQQALRLLDHRRREINGDDRGLRKALRDKPGSLARTGAEVEDAGRRPGEPVEPGRQRRQRLRAHHAVPLRCERVELRAERPAEEPPQRGPGDHHARREPGEAPPRRGEEIVHRSVAASPSCWPTSTPNISAASPRLIASAIFR